jgi:hypothetical protein
MLSNRVTPETLAEKISKLPIQSLVEVDRFVEYLAHKSVGKGVKSKSKRLAHPGFGMWAKQLEGIDSADYALQLRKRAMRRADARASD